MKFPKVEETMWVVQFHHFSEHPQFKNSTSKDHWYEYYPFSEMCGDYSLEEAIEFFNDEIKLGSRFIYSEVKVRIYNTLTQEIIPAELLQDA